ncbi:3'-5' exonuclease [Bacteroidales bacterium OttesenSCG-928-B11]|nr:3'-5' exonuclease [Bacteroidales bacterium OttesenSCG-928-C03]MDL2312924.1 3'-5' exonuclease [Bacteroidales bacterium OttesenSCG-928-B11]MDL2325536.1 3'-5' exonuclease [Bacteroidales bacterium OttesenSCG-928-A14]
MQLNLQRPIVFFDLETTGLNIAKDRIVEIAMLKVMPDGTELSKAMIINPGVSIPRECSEIHGIYDKDVVDKPRFTEIADEIAEFMDDSDLAGFNSNRFDLPLLVEEFLRAGKRLDLRNRKFVDVQAIYHKMEPRNLKAAYMLYCGKELLDAHQAESDTKATYEILKAQLRKYETTKYEDRITGMMTTPIQNDITKLSAFSSENRNVDMVGHIVLDANDQEVFNFGKHKGKTVEAVFRSEPSYYDWMMKADFPLYTKEVISRIKEGMF